MKILNILSVIVFAIWFPLVARLLIQSDIPTIVAISFLALIAISQAELVIWRFND